MTTQTLMAVPRSWSLLARLKLLGGRAVLDRQLAAGADPRSSLELTCRAAMLTRRRTVHSLAAGVEQVVESAEHPPPRLSAEIPVQAGEVLAARSELLRLAAVLETANRPGVRGLAETAMLLTDGAGPVFTPHLPGTLRDAAIRAAADVEAG
jgi:hypothetical protein